MPSYKEVESLRQMCFMLLAKDIHKIAVDIEVNNSPKYMKKSELCNLTANLPSLFVEQIIIKVIETIHQNVQRSRRTIGLQTCLEVLLQPHILRLDLSGLFFKMRLPVQINSIIRNVLCQTVVRMEHLTYINLVSKCDDDILLAISKYCENILDIIINISDLVTDKGITYIAKGCPHLERLEIYKCWGISTEGIKSALLYSKNLKELHCDELGNVLLHHLKHVEDTFKLSHLEQTYSAFEPNEEEAFWINKICPDLKSVRLAIDDEFLFCLSKLGQLRTVELELTSVIGEGFNLAISEIASTLTSLHISCEVVHQEHIVLIGRLCKQLTHFHLTTATIDNDKDMKNNGEYFANLTSLHLQIWKETYTRVECIDFFLLNCSKLNYIVIKAQMNFFTDIYLKHILETNNLVNAIKIDITSDNYVPLTTRSIRRLINQCSMLELLCISSWDVSEEEFFQLTRNIRENNYNLRIT